jgi:hypothetical protein
VAPDTPIMSHMFVLMCFQLRASNAQFQILEAVLPILQKMLQFKLYGLGSQGVNIFVPVTELNT